MDLVTSMMEEGYAHRDDGLENGGNMQRENWEWLRDKIREIGTEGGEEGCRLARDPELQKEILELLKTWIEGQDLSEPGLLEIPERQPLRLRLLRAILEAADDPDRDFLRRAEEGLPLGILEGLPRTPHVVEEQTSWRLGTGSGVGSELCLDRGSQGLREG